MYTQAQWPWRTKLRAPAAGSRYQAIATSYSVQYFDRP